MKAVLLLALLVGSNSAFAFKWSKCKKQYDWKMSTKGAPSTDYPLHLTAYVMVDYTSNASTGASTSTSSYVSSTGDCAAFAKAEEERKMFIADSMTAIKLEAAEGQGEHVESLAMLYGCDSAGRQNFMKMMRSNHSEIFTSEKQNVEDISNRILNRVIDAKDLKNSCLVGA